MALTWRTVTNYHVNYREVPHIEINVVKQNLTDGDTVVKTIITESNVD